ncbi:DELTA-sagatoxin-Srs1a [Channa argus]|uniref:DELTA-sagatoxin-Srs1a n=2 Tax=Channa argus TaxID=215402 RepID=A0A6G1QE84_CHAAH|nr:DELTA-sagatoxin-Srs1a [Channa argus]
MDIDIDVGDILSAVGERAGTSVNTTHRQCTIKIKNNSSDYKLMDPRNYTYSGSCKKPLPATISVSSSGTGLFIKAPHTASGSVGVFTYDLYQNSTKQNRGKMAVMFSNPFDFNLYSNWFAVGVFDMNKQCDYDLYNEMYYNEVNGFVRSEAKCGSLTYTSEGVTIRATMSDSYQPVIKVQLSDD